MVVTFSHLTNFAILKFTTEWRSVYKHSQHGGVFNESH
ncbi:hypothetical protein Nizo2831_1347 [Lactiplantibacillus plantarum]|nr:hypothetical protein GBLP1_g1342 [Lactiplantibacillus plantarum]KZU08895.1 hypothetical protein Nizo2263_1462 [Lactiplantibacillus plantarum]KZU63192.1 hypothetical protein Nizo2830_2347 [Lactiplantibacillus plantarum]KZU66645.1 hypothetical protein Nizo2831_1347 [Lactiplantibacillus plantarum]KZU81933.1 hypothetical protein Nizo3892_1630 [Lactiplantibacillus plantarum]